LGAAAFCRREAISTASLYRWRTLYGGQTAERNEGVTSERTAAFVDLGALRLATSGGGRLELKLDLGDGLVLHLVRG
jgi:hypothetical protein